MNTQADEATMLAVESESRKVRAARTTIRETVAAHASHYGACPLVCCPFTISHSRGARI
jgi:hypothetical protein